MFGKVLTNNNILDLSKLKAFADDKMNVAQKLKFELGMVENIVDKGENADFHTMLSQYFFLRVVKSQLCDKEV